MNKTQERVDEFFTSHPDATECFEALGKVFAEKDKAQQYLAGVAGRYVTTHTKGGITFERESDDLRYQISQQNNVINDKHHAYENATAIDKQASMGEWNAAKEVLYQLEKRLDKQLALEEKDELLAKEEKPATEKDLKENYSVEELIAKVSSHQAIVDGNVKLIAAAKGAQKTKLKKQAKADEQTLQAWQDKLKAAEEKAAEEAVKEMEDHVVTEEDLANNPEMVEQGIKVGDTIQVPVKTNDTGSDEAATT